MSKKLAILTVVVGLAFGSVACVGGDDGTGTTPQGNNPTGTGPGGPGAQATAGGVQINGKAADPKELARLEQAFRTKVAAGSYWYDKRSGLAGYTGSYAQAYAPGYDFGAVPRDASKGGTGILFNGRELHQVEATMIAGLFGISSADLAYYAGAYTLEATGDLTYQDGTYVGNLLQLAQQRGSASSGGGGGGGDNFWSSGGASGNSQGGCSYVSIPSSSGSGSTSVSSGCG